MNLVDFPDDEILCTITSSRKELKYKAGFENYRRFNKKIRTIEQEKYLDKM